MTGASKGLGLSLTQALLLKGHQVLAIARSVPPPQDRLRSLKLDLAEIHQIDEVVSAALETLPLANFERLHLINNAGSIEPIQPVTELRAENIDLNIKLNLIAPMIMTSSFLRTTKNFKGPRTIVNVSSGVAEKPKVSWAAYSAAKGGLRIFSLTLALEYSSDPLVKIVSFNPGVMDTDMQGTIRSQSVANFPDVERFKGFARDGILRSPSVVALHLVNLLAKPENIHRVEITIQDLLA